MKKEKLVFFFPWPEVSGGPVFLTNLANEISRAGLYDVYYSDYPHGLCESLLEDENVKILKYENEGANFEVFPEEPVVLVMAEYWAFMVPRVHPQTRILFFNWHNECLMVLKRDWCATDNFIDQFLELVHSTSAVFFCDKTHWLAHNRPGLTFPQTYVPIVLPLRKDVALPELVRKGERNIAILGRLCLDKIYAVLDLLDNIVHLRDGVRTNVYVIGEGDCQDMLWGRKYPRHIKLIRCNTMEINRALALMKKKVDILFAMGTSSLEGAAIHLPSVIIPNAIKPFECNKYSYLYETTGYALGWYPDQIEELGIKTHTIKEIFEDIYITGKKGEIGERCFEYFRKNHLDNTTSFIDAINQTTLTDAEYEHFCRSHINWKKMDWEFKHAIKSIVGNPVKQLSIFGIPIFAITQIQEHLFNVYIFLIPLFRVKKVGARFSIHLLLAVWVIRFLKKLSKKLFKRADANKEN